MDAHLLKDARPFAKSKRKHDKADLIHQAAAGQVGVVGERLAA